MRVVLFLYNEQQNSFSKVVHQRAGSCRFAKVTWANNSNMKAKIDALLSTYPSIDTNAMGFPRGWESEPLWSQE